MIARGCRRQRDIDATVPGIVECYVEQVRLSPEGIEHHNHGRLLSLCRGYRINEACRIMLAQVDLSIFLISWQYLL